MVITATIWFVRPGIIEWAFVQAKTILDQEDHYQQGAKAYKKYTLEDQGTRKIQKANTDLHIEKNR